MDRQMRDPELLRPVDQTTEMVYVAVNAPVGAEAQQM